MLGRRPRARNVIAWCRPCSSAPHAEARALRVRSTPARGHWRLLPLPGEIAGYCGRCGAPFTTDSGPFCGRCGNAVVAAPPAATAYSYPVVPAASVPAAQHKLSHTRLLILAGGAIAALVVVITIIVV